MDLASLFAEGLRHHIEGRLDLAKNIYGEVLKGDPKHADALHHLGLIHLQSGVIFQAIEAIQSSLVSDPRNSRALANLGYCFNLIGDHPNAIASCKAALEINPSNDGAWTNLGNAQRGLKSFVEAMGSYERALKLCPENPHNKYNVGLALFDQGEFNRAKEYFQRYLESGSSIPEAHNSLAACLLKLCEPLLALRHAEAAVGLKPDYAEAWLNQGSALNDLKRHEEALASYERSIELKPDYADAWNNRGNALSDLRRHEEALASYERSIELKPDADYGLGNLVHAQMKICDWAKLKQRRRTLEDKLFAEGKVSTPLAVLGLFDNPELQKRCAEIYAQDRLNLKSGLGVVAPRPKRGKIRIGYFSMDFKETPVSYLIAELFELHDRSQFEIHGFSFGSNTRDYMRQRVEKGLDNFLDVKHLSDLDIAHLSREYEIDIAIDLGGHTQDSRPELFVERVAPIQINYLGYPGTWGSDCMDYFIGDKVAISDKNLGHFSEKIIFLPNSFLVNPSHRPIASKKPSRQDHGLPSGSFVFCCFNNSWKITPNIFELWMKILQQVSNSVLWLSEMNSSAKKNIQRNFSQNGLNTSRLIFAKRLPDLADHFARYQLADLFLDTSPYGAHTTASDALWTGVPVLTLQGQSFAARVAASLLTNIGVPELITHTIEEYFSLAVELANNPNKLAAIRAKLAQNRLTTPLFNTELFARHIESAYKSAYDSYHAGMAPDHIYVNP